MKNYILKLFLAVSIIMASAASSWAQLQLEFNGNWVVSTDNKNCFNDRGIVKDSCIQNKSCTVMIKEINFFNLNTHIQFIALESNQQVFDKTITVDKYFVKTAQSNPNRKYLVFEQNHKINEIERVSILLDQDGKTILQTIYEYKKFLSNRFYFYGCSN